MSIIYYTTHDGIGEFEFEFLETWGDGWRVYINDTPDYGSRDIGGAIIHTYTDDDGKEYICWTQTIHSLKDAQKIASMWAELTMRYIRTGERF